VKSTESVPLLISKKNKEESKQINERSSNADYNTFDHSILELRDTHAGKVSKFEALATTIKSHKLLFLCSGSYLSVWVSAGTAIAGLYFLDEATTPPDTSVWYWVSAISFGVQTIFWQGATIILGRKCINS